jgi:hypothetical protein
MRHRGSNTAASNSAVSMQPARVSCHNTQQTQHQEHTTQCRVHAVTALVRLTSADHLHSSLPHSISQTQRSGDAADAQHKTLNLTPKTHSTCYTSAFWGHLHHLLTCRVHGIRQTQRCGNTANTQHRVVGNTPNPTATENATHVRTCTARCPAKSTASATSSAVAMLPM